MHRRVVVIGLAVMLTAAAAGAQVSGIQMYSLPNTAGSSQWVKLGTYNASQQGYDIDVKIVSSQGYNAIISQDQITYVQFKSSNANSVDGNGFAGDSWWYQIGPNTGAPSQVVWVANAPGVSATAFTLFAYFGIFTGSDSYYVVDAPNGTTWTNIAVAGQSNPGAGSSAVLIAQNEMYIGSTSSFAGNVGIGTTTPGAKLEVDGSVKLTSNSGASITFQDGTVQSTAYTGVIHAWVRHEGDRSQPNAWCGYRQSTRES